MAKVVTFSSPVECWNDYQTRVFTYWGRLQEAASNASLRSPTPTLRFDKTTGIGSCELGGSTASRHVPMATPEEIAFLLDEASDDALVIGGPPKACVLAIENLRVVRCEGEAGFCLKTTSYKFSLLYKSDSGKTWSEGASALRFESESAAGNNSWILNHPIHHIQPGDSKFVRIRHVERFGVVGFVDWVLRSLAETVWSNMYEDLYLALSCAGGSLYERFGKDSERPQDVCCTIADALRNVLAAGRAENVRWYQELELWRRDSGAYSQHAPELYECFSI